MKTTVLSILLGTSALCIGCESYVDIAARLQLQRIHLADLQAKVRIIEDRIDAHLEREWQVTQAELLKHAGPKPADAAKRDELMKKWFEWQDAKRDELQASQQTTYDLLASAEAAVADSERVLAQMKKGFSQRSK